MGIRLTREELHSRVWSRPVIHVAAELGLSDAAVHKICRKHAVPTPPPGYWTKVANGKRSALIPLPPGDADDRRGSILVGGGSASAETEALTAARSGVDAALQDFRYRADASPPSSISPVLSRTLKKLGAVHPDRAQLVTLNGSRVIAVSVRPASAERAGTILAALGAAADAAGIELVPGDAGSLWRVGDETVSFELVEVPDRVEHVSTPAELAAVARWELKEEADRRRYGRAFGYNRPFIPKWEEHLRGRLAVRLEQVRIRSDEDRWGKVIPRVFADSRTRDISKAVPKILSTIAAIAAAKRENRVCDGQRRRAWEQAEQLRIAAAHAAVLERERETFLRSLLGQSDELGRLEALLARLRRAGGSGPRVSALIRWSLMRRERLERALTPVVLEERLSASRLFGND